MSGAREQFEQLMSTLLPSDDGAPARSLSPASAKAAPANTSGGKPWLVLLMAGLFAFLFLRKQPPKAPAQPQTVFAPPQTPIRVSAAPLTAGGSGLPPPPRAPMAAPPITKTIHGAPLQPHGGGAKRPTQVRAPGADPNFTLL